MVQLVTIVLRVHVCMRIYTYDIYICIYTYMYVYLYLSVCVYESQAKGANGGPLGHLAVQPGGLQEGALKLIRNTRVLITRTHARRTPNS